MKKLITAALAISLHATSAWASEPAPGDCAAMEGDAKVRCEEAKAALEALGDCSDKEGDAKAECDKKKAELEAKAQGEKKEPSAAKGGKAKRSDTNRMEVVNEDE